MKRVGIFGGSFDPVHNAHLALAQAALEALALDQVLWMPAGQPWQKTRRITAGVHREAMVRLAIEDQQRFVLDRRELVATGPSYTLDSVRALQAEQPSIEWFLLIGQDQYAGLHTWQHWEELLDRVVLAVANRPGVPPAVHTTVLQHPHRSVPLPMQDISSTAIRRRVAAGEPIGALVPPAVARYIERHALYRFDGAHTGS